jgi:hypothetical protein
VARADGHRFRHWLIFSIYRAQLMHTRGPSHGAWRGTGQIPSVDGYRRLSVRVIEQALRDIVAAPGSPSDHDSARLFLAGSPMLKLWCELAALDPARIVAHAGHLVSNGSTFGRTPRRLARSARPQHFKCTV